MPQHSTRNLSSNSNLEPRNSIQHKARNSQILSIYPIVFRVLWRHPIKVLLTHFCCPRDHWIKPPYDGIMFLSLDLKRHPLTRLTFFKQPLPPVIVLNRTVFVDRLFLIYFVYFILVTTDFFIDRFFVARTCVCVINL